MTSEASPAAAAGAKKAKKDESGGGGGGSSSSTIKKSKKKKSETTVVKTEDVSTPSSPAPPPSSSNSNALGASQTIDIPIFTEEFLEHNKVLSHASLFLTADTAHFYQLPKGIGSWIPTNLSRNCKLQISDRYALFPNFPKLSLKTLTRPSNSLLVVSTRCS